MKNVAKFAVIMSIFTMSLLFSGLAFAAVPDVLECDAEPSVIHATWDQNNSSMTQVTVQLMSADDETYPGEPVKMCGVEIKCESQNTDVLNNGVLGGAIAIGTTNKFGRVVLNFYSTGNRNANVADNVEIRCRSLQQESCSTLVDVKAHVPDMVELSKCPNGDAFDKETPDIDYPDIIADGVSRIVIAAQLKDDLNPDVPVKKSGVKIKFVSDKTNIVRAVDGTDMVEAYTNDQGVAYATFVSSGAGSENDGDVDIMVEVDGGYGILKKTINVETTLNYGTTNINGQLYVSEFPLQILADGTSTVEACVQLRKDNGHIIRNPPAKVVSFVSHDISQLVPTNPFYTTNPGYAEVEDEDGRFPQGGVYTTTFRSNGIHDQNTLTEARIEASAEFFKNDDVDVELVDAQYWPEALDVTMSPGKILCDGESKVKVTAQLLDKTNGYPVFMSGRPITFTSRNSELVYDSADVDNDGHAIIVAETNAFGYAYAEFTAKDCKEDNVAPGNAYIDVSSISDSISVTNTYVTVIQPHGFKPNGINVYTDQDMMGYDESNPAHASPSVISADGDKPVYVTAQVCERENPNTADSFCNPVKRAGIRVEFHVMDNTIVMNKDSTEFDSDVDSVYAYTDEEGKATAIFRSSGTIPVSNEGCTKIRVTGQNGEILGNAWAQVCARQDEGMTPNAVWTWAQPAFITADGTSSTVLRTALLWCNWDQIIYEKELYSQRGLSSLTAQTPLELAGMINDSTPDYTHYCKPVQLEGAQVKFEVSDPSIVDDGMSGRKIIAYTDEYGHAAATFYSAGFDTPNIGKTEVDVFVDHIGEDVTPLNKLFVTTEEKTWPWCTEPLTCGAADADTDNNQFIGDSELLHYILNWMGSGSDTGVCEGYPKAYPCNETPCDPDSRLIEAVLVWMHI